MKTKFAEFAGDLYVDAISSGIPFLIVLTGGFTLYQFPGDQITYLKVSDIKSWYQNELNYASEKEKRLYREMISVCETVEQQFRAETEGVVM